VGVADAVWEDGVVVAAAGVEEPGDLVGDEGETCGVGDDGALVAAAGEGAGVIADGGGGDVVEGEGSGEVGGA